MRFSRFKVKGIHKKRTRPGAKVNLINLLNLIPFVGVSGRMGELYVVDGEWEARFSKADDTAYIALCKGDEAWGIICMCRQDIAISLKLYVNQQEVASMGIRISDPKASIPWFSDMQEFRKTFDMHGARKTLQYIFDTILDYFRGW
jgi:hypothetical protein